MRDPRLRRAAAVVVLVLAVVPTLVGLGIAWGFGLPDAPIPGLFLAAAPAAMQARFDDIGVTVALVYGVLAAALLVRRPHPVIAILVVHALGSALVAFSVPWGLLAERVPDLPLAGFLTHAPGWAYLPGTTATTVIPLLLTRAVLGLRDRVLVAVGLVLAVVATAAGFVHQVPGAVANPFAIPDAGVQAALPAVYGVCVTLGVALSLVVAVLVALRRRRSTGVRRNRLGWLLVGHILLTVSYTLLILPSVVEPPALLVEVGLLLPVLGQIFYPSAVLVLVLGPRLRGIDARVNGVLTATILAVAAAVGYVVVADLFARLGVGSPEGPAFAAVLVALALVPARERLARAVGRLIWGTDEDPARAVWRLGERVGELEPGGRGLAELTRALRAAGGLGWLAIRARGATGPRAEAGRRPVAPTLIPLRAGGEEVGTLEAATEAGMPLPRLTRRRLEGLAPVIAVAVRLAEANTDLADARDGILAARHSERRALRRELHDGVGPALAGVGFGLDAVLRQLDTDPASAAALADRLAADLAARVREVRALVRAIGTDDSEHDLAADLRDLARDFAQAGPRFELDLDGADAVPPRIRRPLSLIASEAVHNAVRHADADVIRIAVRVGQDRLEFEVADDGRGFDPRAASPGIGLATMRERVAAFGAEVRVDTAPDAGTRVRVVLRDPAPHPTREKETVR